MNLSQQIERMHQFAWWMIWGVAFLVAVVVVVSILDVIQPRRVVERARKSRGIDMMSNVVDEPMFFRSLRGQRIGLTVLAALFGILFCSFGLKWLDHWQEKARENAEGMLELRATTLWLEQQKQAPASIEKLDALQEQADALQDAIRNQAPDREQKLEALKTSIADYLESAKPQQETLDELGDTLRQLEKVRGEGEGEEEKP